jgi:hypothetical protein
MNIENHIRYSARPSWVASRFFRSLSASIPTTLHEGLCRIYHDPDYPVYEKDVLHTVNAILIDAPTREALREAFEVLADKKLPVLDGEESLLWVHPASKEHRSLLEEHGFSGPGSLYKRKKGSHINIDEAWFLKSFETQEKLRNLKINEHITTL